MTVNSKKIIIIAGPNGAGKTTFAKNFLPLVYLLLILNLLHLRLRD
jgi:ABC-type Mn2+/Zn2+ transport system ATPase subunit